MSEDFENENYYNQQIEKSNSNEIRVNYDVLNEFKDKDVYEMKLGNLSFLKRKRFTENINAKDEKIKIPLDNGKLEEKPILPINFIRWKYSRKNNNNNKQIINDDDSDLENSENSNFDKKEKEGNSKENEINNKEIDNYLNLVEKVNNNNSKMISNTKIVEWSDGSMQLIIGKEIFDINLSNIDNSRYAIYDKDNKIFDVKDPVRKRFLIVPSDMTSSNMDLRYKQTGENTTKIKMTYSYFDKNTFNKEEFAKGRSRRSGIDALKRTPAEKGRDKILPNLYKRK